MEREAEGGRQEEGERGEEEREGEGEWPLSLLLPRHHRRRQLASSLLLATVLIIVISVPPCLHCLCQFTPPLSSLFPHPCPHCCPALILVVIGCEEKKVKSK